MKKWGGHQPPPPSARLPFGSSDVLKPKFGASTKPAVETDELGELIRTDKLAVRQFENTREVISLHPTLDIHLCLHPVLGPDQAFTSLK
jgi:hypothetical protein